MADRRLILIVSFVVILLFFYSPFALAASSGNSQLSTLVSSGKHIIILFHSKVEEERTANSTEDGDADFYDDWSNYLDSFIRNQGSDVVIYRMSIQDARKFFNSTTIPNDEWSIAFLIKDRPTLYSPTPILEPDTYEFVGKYFKGKDNIKEAKRFDLSYLTAPIQ